MGRHRGPKGILVAIPVLCEVRRRNDELVRAVKRMRHEDQCAADVALLRGMHPPPPAAWRPEAYMRAGGGGMGGGSVLAPPLPLLPPAAGPFRACATAWWMPEGRPSATLSTQLGPTCWRPARGRRHGLDGLFLILIPNKCLSQISRKSNRNSTGISFL